jgi:iron complex outermembrane receptor protein
MNNWKRSVRQITAWSLLSACSLSILPALAQSQGVDGVDEDIIEEVIVTGSRIPRTGFDTLQPAIVLDSEFIEAGGFTDIATALNQIPAFGVPGTSTQGDQSSQGVGQEFVNFFGLGSQRTLTLVNGHRFVSSNTPALGSSANAGLQVDLNVIPASLIDRVETIAIGGAPIYGADAIAGTVNIIMKDDFEGFDIKTSYGVSSESDMEETEFSVAWGANSADGRGNVTLGLEYTDREGMIESDRDHLREGWQFREPADPSSPFTRELVANAHANIVSGDGVITPGATLLPNFGIGQFDGQYLQFSPDGSLRPYDVGAPTGNAVWSLGGEGLFLPDVTALFTPIERTLATAFAHYDLSDSVEVFGELWVAHVEATEAANQPAYQSGFFGEESLSLEFPIDHPLLTPSAQATLAGLTDGGVPITSFHIQRSSTDLRPNNNANNSEMNLLRFVGGMRGDFEVANRFFNWDVSYNFGQSTADTRSLDVVSERMMYALDVIPDPVSGELGCRVVVDPTSRPPDPGAPFGTTLQQARFDNCVPLDIFGDGRPSAEAIDYITVNQVNKTVMNQQVVSANIGGDLFELPAGSFGVAAGISHREEKGDFQAGGFAELGLGRSTPVESVFGAYDSDEIYVEFYAPLISSDMDIPLVSSLSMEGAYRRLDNSLAGSDDVWTIGGRYAPIPDIEVRGNVTRSVRAPAITELFLPLSGTNSFASDPCDQRFVDNGPNPTTRRANCIADGIADPDNFVSNVANASVQGVTGGNIGLENEVADAWTVGAIFRPRFVEGLSLAIDYVDFDIESAIAQFTLTQIMESCYDQAGFPNSFCGLFSRQANGQLPPTDAFQSGFVNAGQRTFQGVTIEGIYSMDLFAGQFDVSASIMNIQEDITRIQESVQDDGGEIGQSDWQGQVNFTYSQDQWSAYLQARMIGKGVWSNDDTPTARDVMGEGDVWFLSGSFNYEINDTIGLQFNINNILDELPSPGAIASGNSAVYGNMGRFYRFGVTISL